MTTSQRICHGTFHLKLMPSCYFFQTHMLRKCYPLSEAQLLCFHIRMLKYWGTWVAQLVKQLTLNFGSRHDLTVHGPHIGLCAEQGDCLGFSLSLSLSLSLTLAGLYTHSLSLNINKYTFFKNAKLLVFYNPLNVICVLVFLNNGHFLQHLAGSVGGACDS